MTCTGKSTQSFHVIPLDLIFGRMNLAQTLSVFPSLRISRMVHPLPHFAFRFAILITYFFSRLPKPCAMATAGVITGKSAPMNPHQTAQPAELFLL